MYFESSLALNQINVSAFPTLKPNLLDVLFLLVCVQGIGLSGKFITTCVISRFRFWKSTKKNKQLKQDFDLDCSTVGWIIKTIIVQTYNLYFTLHTESAVFYQKCRLPKTLANVQDNWSQRGAAAKSLPWFSTVALSTRRLLWSPTACTPNTLTRLQTLTNN